jgi:AmmeMemoRadiSam system protein A
MHPLVELAKKTVEEYTKTGKVPEKPDELDELMSKSAGVFVSLKKHGQLRGCIGTIEPVTECVATEVIRNAVSAATEDPRFLPVEDEELGELDYSVDVLTTPETVTDISELDPKRYGVIVRKDMRRGLLLPDLEGVDTVGEQLSIAKQKAFIDPADEDVAVQRFEVTRYR